MNYYETIKKKSQRQKEKNDCSVKAVALATGRDYDEVHDAFNRAGRKIRHTTPRVITDQVVENMGYIWVDVTLNYDAKTVRMLEKEVTKRKTLIVFVCKHVLCLRNGKVQDWTAGRMHRVQEIFELEKHGGEENSRQEAEGLA